MTQPLTAPPVDKRRVINSKGPPRPITAISPYKSQQGGASGKAALGAVSGRIKAKTARRPAQEPEKARVGQGHTPTLDIYIKDN